METKGPALSRRLSGIDAAFLYLERKEIPLHIASVSIFDGPIPFDEIVASIESKLHLIPRYRQIVVETPYNATHPIWEDDPHFDIHRHFFQTRLDAPGGQAELEALAGRVLSQVMDRRKPLWDVHVIDGLADGRGALIARVHHALADGVSGAGLLKVMLDPTPEGSHAIRKPPPQAPEPPAANPSLAETIGQTVHGVFQNLITAEAGLLGLARTLTDERGQKGLQGLAGLLPELATSVERLPFNRPCTGERKFCWAEFEFAEAQAIRAKLGGTVNDVILTVLTRALARYVKLHKQTITNRLVRMICPVSLREDHGETLGNQISFLPVVLPMDIRDPAEMLRAVASRTEIMKNSGAAGLVALAAGCLHVAPAPLQALFWRAIPEIIPPVPLFNMICTNVPGCAVPLYAAGRRMLASYPQVPTGYELGMGCAVQSYDGKLCFGLIADARAGADVDRLRDFLYPAFRELYRAAGVKKPRRKRTSKPAAPEPSQVNDVATQETGPEEGAPAPERLRCHGCQGRLMTIPNLLLKRLYTVGSLKNNGAGAQFALKNRLGDAELVAVREITLDGKPVALDGVRLDLEDHRVLTPAQVDSAHPLAFPLRAVVTIQMGSPELDDGRHEIELAFEARPFGKLHLKVEDAIAVDGHNRARIPRDERDDYAPEIIQRRRTLVEEVTGVKLKHLSHHSFDPHLVKGNCENFLGVAQVPIGFAGPLHVCAASMRPASS